MRWKEILFESVKKYAPMFVMFADEQGRTPEWAVNCIKSTESMLHREDRVVWALRWERYKALVDGARPVRGDRQALKLKMERDLGVADSVRSLDEFENLMDKHFAHWLSMPIQPIHDYVFGRQAPGEVWAKFAALEEKWVETRKQVLRHDKYPVDKDLADDDEEEEERLRALGYGWDKVEREIEKRKRSHRGEIEKVIDFGNGWAWWNLNRSFCRLEGDAMGHCGNSASPSSGDRVLSLRRDMGNGEFRPSLTFILDSGGMLGEMKGRANEKPAERYHDMIVALLKKSDLVRGISGGGYAADNNFSIYDLPEEVRAPLMAGNPMLETVHDAWKQFKANPAEFKVKEHFRTKLAQNIKDNGFRFTAIDFHHLKEPRIVISEPLSVEHMCNRHSMLRDVDTIFDDLPDYLYEHGADDVERHDADYQAKELRADHFQPVFSAVLPYIEEFRLDGVHWAEIGAVNETKYAKVVSVHNYLNPSVNDGNEYYDEDEMEYAELPPLESLNDGLDTSSDADMHYTWADLEDNFQQLNDVEALVVEYVFDQKDETKSKAMREFLKAVVTPGQTVFSDDPNQMTFPFYGDNK